MHLSWFEVVVVTTVLCGYYIFFFLWPIPLAVTAVWSVKKNAKETFWSKAMKVSWALYLLFSAPMLLHALLSGGF
ncbi:hypothetical protein [Actinomyces vulturis]|uniref:hypothetical protein n=1 Tax=Actinomyces vulturis TaxID=1857645 RepID=UPI00082B514F|nr:hypothetical protein [Actinomyces vulturis]